MTPNLKKQLVVAGALLLAAVVYQVAIRPNLAHRRVDARIEVLPGTNFEISVDGAVLRIDRPEIFSLETNRVAPGDWSGAWSDRECWPGGTKSEPAAWALAPRYDDDGSLCLGGIYRQIVPGSVHLSSADGSKAFVEGEDFRVNYEWGFLAGIDGRLGSPGSAELRFEMKAGMQRLDLVQRAADGSVSVKKGVSRLVSPQLPEPDPGCRAVAGVYVAPWLHGSDPAAWALAVDDVNAIADDIRPPAPVNPEAVRNTLAKLRAGKAVSIAFIGDSITLGAEAGPWWRDDSATWRGRFLRGLRERFPNAEIKEIEAFQGGRGIAYGLEVLRDTVLPAKPDLAMVMVGVNDCHKSLSAAGPKTPPDAFAKHYDELVRQLVDAGVEVIGMTSMQTNPFDANGDAARWGDYLAAIRDTAIRHHTGLAETYERWMQLVFRGIPPHSQLHNWINHPGSWGHKVFSDAALEFFPAAN